MEDPAYTEVYPHLQRVSLTIRLRNGQEVTGECHVTSGEPARPIAQSDLDHKFEQLAEPLWGPARARQLRDALHRIDQCNDVAELVPFNP